MNCQDISTILDERRERRLTATERRAVDAHLGECLDCERAWHAQMAILEESIPAVPAELLANALRLLARGAGARPRRVTSRVVLGSAVLVAGAVLAAVAVVTMRERTVEGSGSVMVATQSPTVAAADALSAPSDESLQVESVRGGSQAGRASGRFPDFDVLPLLRVPPHYPKAALEVGLEGAVTVEFTITEGGSVEDIVVVDSTDSVFEGPAMLAISRWKYLPRVIGGEFVATPDVRTILRFVLEADAALAAKLAREPPPPDRPGGIEFDEFEALVEPAWECLAAQDLRCAELVLDEVMATYELDRSQAALIWEFYGYIFTQYGDYGRAIAAYETAIGQGGATHVHLAHLYFERGQYDMALRMLLRYAEEIESRGGRLSSGIIEFIDRLRVLGITEEVL